jgi:hypothetical protein
MITNLKASEVFKDDTIDNLQSKLYIDNQVRLENYHFKFNSVIHADDFGNLVSLVV